MTHLQPRLTGQPHLVHYLMSSTAITSIPRTLLCNALSLFHFHIRQSSSVLPKSLTKSSWSWPRALRNSLIDTRSGSSTSDIRASSNVPYHGGPVGIKSVNDSSHLSHSSCGGHVRMRGTAHAFCAGSALRGVLCRR